MAELPTLRFCPYGQHFVEDKGFKFKFHLKSQTKRGMCPSCQAKRRLPKEVLDRMTEEEKAERRAASQRAAKESQEKAK